MLSFYLSLLDTDEKKCIFEQTYKENKNRMAAIALRYLHKSEDAEDAVHEVFLRIAEDKTKFFSIEAHKQTAYLDILIRNVSIDIFKKDKKTVSVDYEDDFQSDYSLENEVVALVSRDELIEFVLSLPTAQRDAVYLKSVLKMENAEIADLLHISKQTLRRRICDARRKILDFIESRGE